MIYLHQSITAEISQHLMPIYYVFHHLGSALSQQRNELMIDGGENLADFTIILGTCFQILLFFILLYQR